VKVSEINNLFQSFSTFKILVIGDVIIDSYLWGKVERISPEAPIPVVSIVKRENRLGGAANVALNLRSLGANPIICAATGNDDNSILFNELCEQNGILTAGIISLHDRPTTCKTRVIGGNQHLLRVDEEIDIQISDIETKKLSERIFLLLNKEDINAIVFEDYDKGVISIALIEEVTKEAKKRKIPVCVDPKKRNFLHYKNVTLFKPNFRELCEGLKINLHKNNFEEIFKAVQVFHNEKNINEIMVTLSELGIFISNGKEYHIIPTQVRDVADVSGAGDTVISVATLCKAAKLNVINTAAISNIAGGLVCEKVGVVPIEKDVLIEACKNFFANI